MSAAEKHAAAQRARYAAKRATGLCARGGCGRKPLPGKSICRKCLPGHNARTRAAKAALRAARAAEGLCRGCGKRKAKGYRCKACRAKKRKAGA